MTSGLFEALKPTSILIPTNKCMHTLFYEHLWEIEVTNFGIDSRHSRPVVDKNIVSHWTNIVKKNLE